MIIITKNKIIAAVCLFLLFLVSAGIIGGMSAGKNITAFSSYENIIEGELLPAADKGADKVTESDSQEADKAEKSSGAEESGEGEKAEAAQKETALADKESATNKILKHFFVLGEAKPKETAEPTVTPDVQKEPVLKSESVKIDKGLKVSNSTSYQVNPLDFLNKPLAFSVDNSGPQVLIMHTHTTESFSEETYVKGAPDRNLDETKNITVVGSAMEEVFKRNGIGVIHDKTVHDYPSYNGAYQKAAATINKNLAENKGIKVVLDVHRDGITRDDGTKVKLVTDINGEATAQIMLVVGTNVNLTHDNWQENFKFASKIQAKAIEMFPSLMRPIDLRQERFNEQLTLGSLIVEVGSNGNTMEEAIRGGCDIAEVICAVLKGQ
ncbi:MAG: stage II sporulation protein P [Clostridia bacterium]|nr:stage II sporulation protein P [Clostridia bacterium]